MDKRIDSLEGFISKQELALLKKECKSAYLRLTKTLTDEQKELLDLYVGALKMEGAIKKAEAYKSGFNEGLEFFTKEQK